MFNFFFNQIIHHALDSDDYSFFFFSLLLNLLDRRREPCKGCVAPYGFRNHMPLADDSEIFVTKVKETNISGNLDAPEGGFDAIMQAIVCQRQIGWRADSRKLVVFSTDSSFHYAGDGKVNLD